MLNDLSKERGRMKKIIGNKLMKGMLLLLLVVGGFVGFSFLETKSAQAVPLNPVYRLYNQTTGNHFYTIDYNEAIVATSNGYVEESNGLYGIGWNRAATPITIYRLYSKYTGDHFYTSDEAEAYAAYNDGFGWYAFEEGWDDSYPGGPIIHRFFDLKTGGHFYTANQAEATYVNDNLIATYKYEGIGWGGEQEVE